MIQELDTKQRKIRSLRGFFLYALEIIENGKDYEILETNLQPLFWRKVKNIIRQNKKSALQEFLFGSQDSIAAIEPEKDFEAKIENLQQQVDSLQEKVMNLEITLENSKYALSRTLKAFEAMKIIQQGDSTLKDKKGSYLTQNDRQVRDPTYRGKEMESKSFSEASKMTLETRSHSHEYNIASNQNQAQNAETNVTFEKQQNFITLSQISEPEKIEIIQTGFQRHAEGRISLKKYYQDTEEYSLFESKRYSIKYESIRRTKLYQQLKP